LSFFFFRCLFFFFFYQAASVNPPKNEDEDPSIGFPEFAKLIATILTESNMAAKKKGRPTVPVPSLKDLQVLFNRADVDGSKTVDEYEFLGLYQQVMDGTVKGLGDSAFSFYIRPHQLMQFGQHEHHPDTGSSLSHTLAHMDSYMFPFF
jgi:hypothetical protein